MITSTITETIGDFPRYGEDDDRADDIAKWLMAEYHNRWLAINCTKMRNNCIIVDHHIKRGLF